MRHPLQFQSSFASLQQLKTTQSLKKVGEATGWTSTLQHHFRGQQPLLFSETIRALKHTIPDSDPPFTMRKTDEKNSTSLQGPKEPDYTQVRATTHSGDTTYTSEQLFHQHAKKLSNLLSFHVSEPQSNAPHQDLRLSY